MLPQKGFIFENVTKVYTVKLEIILLDKKDTIEGVEFQLFD